MPRMVDSGDTVPRGWRLVALGTAGGFYGSRLIKRNRPRDFGRPPAEFRSMVMALASGGMIRRKHGDTNATTVCRRPAPADDATGVGHAARPPVTQDDLAMANPRYRWRPSGIRFRRQASLRQARRPGVVPAGDPAANRLGCRKSHRTASVAMPITDNRPQLARELAARIPGVKLATQLTHQSRPMARATGNHATLKGLAPYGRQRQT